MEISLLRNTGLSLYYHIKNHISTQVTNEQLTSQDYKAYQSKYKLWYEVKPIIRLNGIQTFDFSIDINNGTIIMDNQLTSTDIVTADYKYSLAYIYDDYPDNLENNQLKLPAISIVNEDTVEKPYQLTNGKKINRYYVVEIWAERGTQRDDLSETVKELFDQTLPLIDFNQGFPIQNNRINYNFDITSQTIEIMYLEEFRMYPSRTLEVGEKQKYIMSIDIMLSYFR